MTVNIPIVVPMSVEESNNVYNLNVDSLDNVYALGAADEINILSPQKTSELINDGDGTSPFTTEEYVQSYHDDSKQDRLTASNAGSGISITEDGEGNVIISNTQTSAEWGSITGDITSQTDLVNYIEENGGKIDSISVNGTPQEIVNKNVDIEVPTRTSDLTNDSGYATEVYVQNYHDSTKQDVIDANNKLDADYIDGLSVVATTGLYDDLIDKPNIPVYTSDLINNTNYVSDANYVHTDNNFTSEEKTKLNSIESGAEVNKIDTVQVNGVSLTINNKTVNVPVPTATSDLTNDSGFITNTVNNLTNYYLKSETYTQAEVNSLIGAITTLNIQVVEQLPTTDISSNTIYFVPNEDPEYPNIYDEYIYVNNSWELIGTTKVDLSDYYTKTQVDTLLDNKVDKVTGKGLSTEDFTTAEKTKLAGIEAGAEVNVNADWDATSGDAEILNKPTTISGYGITDAYTQTEVDNLLDNKQDVLTAGENITIKVAAGHELPTGYTEVEYIASSGNQYIDTGVIAKSGVSSVVDFEYITLPTDNSMLAARHGSADRLYLIHSYPSGRWCYGYGTFYTLSNAGVITDFRYVVKSKLDVGEQSIVVNDMVLVNGTVATEIDTGLSLYLFAMNYNGGASAGSAAKLYECEIYFDDVLQRHYVPCIQDSNSEVGLYDLVSNTFFGNDGTGVFTAGGVVEAGTIISATDTTYTAGTGLVLSDTEFSVDYSTVQPTLVSGSNIKTLNGQSILGSGDITISVGAAMYVEVSSDGQGNYSSQETYDEIVEAINAGRAVYVLFDARVFTYNGDDGEGEPYYFVTHLINEDVAESMEFTLAKEGNETTWDLWVADYTRGLPTVTSADNGKVLRVVNGVWSAVELTSASGVSF